ncbi:acyltransferase [Apibacter sp. HY039]|uniref:acyltransferase family protein n=1 Tax=Apibacter sp. HY039 TaxID=2501476 RepID=UPI000FEB995B|nr:acyltransferase [Apibacter sp. HY039]
MHKNNFNFLRLLFASLVLITHSYNLLKIPEIFHKILGVELSYIGLNGFFIISGYLIFKSFNRSNSVFRYLWNRILRIYPALAVVLILTFLFGYFVYQGEEPYFHSRTILYYVPNGLSLIYLKTNISGFFSTNPYPGSVNGSLWTLIHEFGCYLILLPFYFFRRSKFLLYILTTLLLILLYFILIKNPSFYHKQIHAFNVGKFIEFLSFFIMGALFNFIDITNKKRNYILISIGVSFFLIALFIDNLKLMSHIFLPLVIIPFGSLLTPAFSFLNKTDISYGVYIYSFLVQQSLIYFFNILQVEILIVLTIIISYILGYLSWNLIEKQALKYKNLNLVRK